jgi:hypothetical protein
MGISCVDVARLFVTTVVAVTLSVAMATVGQVNSFRLKHVPNSIFEEFPEASVRSRPFFKFPALGLVLLGAVANLLLRLVK